MSIDRKTLLLRRKAALNAMSDPNAAPDLRALAKMVKDSSEALLGLKAALVRKLERTKAHRRQE